MKISNKQKFKQIVSQSSLEIDFQDFINFYKQFTEKPHSVLS